MSAGSSRHGVSVPERADGRPTAATDPTPTPPLTNWAGNHVYAATKLRRPRSLDELATTVTDSDTGSVRVIGSRHSFTAIADADTLISLEALNGAEAIRVDHQTMTVGVGAAVTYAQLARHLNAEGLGLENLASLPHISVCGAIATATHGSGDAHGNLATAVRGLTLLDGTGTVRAFGPDDPRLMGAVVHLGLLGPLLEVTLEVVPAYRIRQDVHEELTWPDLVRDADGILGLGYSVSIFHHLTQSRAAVWVKTREDAPIVGGVPGTRPASAPRHPIVGVDAAATTAQGGELGVWSERLPHFRSDFTPSAGEEIQSEIFVERARVGEALAVLEEISERIAPALLVGEVRSVRADGLWCSPQHGRDSAGLHFTWRRDPETVAANVALIEAVLDHLRPRPHWGKVFSVTPERLAAEYPRAEEFAALRKDLDPQDAFVNDWARRHVPFLLER